MLFIIRYLGLMVVVLFSMMTPAFADAVSDDLTKLLNSVQSMKANFTQVTYNNKGKITQKVYGRMAMQRPGRFRWDVTKPMPQLIIANQNKLWIYDPDLQQVTIKALKKASGETPALLLSHENKSLDASFVIKTLKKEKATTANRRWFVLTSKKSDEIFVSIQMGFLNNQIQTMRLQDNLGHLTVIQFQNIQQNITLPSSLFSFKSSSKIDVIDETRRK